MTVWSIYLLRDNSGSLYTGITTDVPRRFAEHCSGSPKAAKYTRSKKGLEVVFSCEVGSRSLASRIEYRIKRLSKKQKETIVSQHPDAAELIIALGGSVGGNEHSAPGDVP